jgi:hypothetical protein
MHGQNAKLRQTEIFLPENIVNCLSVHPSHPIPSKRRIAERRTEIENHILAYQCSAKCYHDAKQVGATSCLLNPFIYEKIWDELIRILSLHKLTVSYLVSIVTMEHKQSNLLLSKAHLTNLNLNNIKMIEAMGLRIITSGSP